MAISRAFGLTAIQNLVQSRGGRITMITHPNKDKQFQVLLPAAGRTLLPERIGRLGPARAGSPHGAILVVEDEVALRLAVATMLRNRGFSVLEAGTGELALDLIRSEKRIALVLLDLTLPGKCGRQVFEELRRIQPGLKIVLTSAHARESITRSIEALSHAGFIRKPYRFQELEELLRGVLALQRTRPRSAVTVPVQNLRATKT
jgi:CheY-like chemotaxis protein